MITGAVGFIGRSLCSRFKKHFKVIAIDRNPLPETELTGLVQLKGDIADLHFLKAIINQYSPDVIIHCAALSYQRFFCSIDSDHYEKINAIATENICREAALVNPEIFIIFLSSISVYGEKQTNLQIKETDELYPTSDYAKSKRNAEIRLRKLFEDRIAKKIDILRLAPVYNLKMLSSIEKRVLAPIKIAFFRFGSGKQKISVLSSENLVDFLFFRVNHMPSEATYSVFNVCDKTSYSFNSIIAILRQSVYYPDLFIIQIPMIWIQVTTCFLKVIFRKRSTWIQSWYDKLSNDFVFDNQAMIDTGFFPKHDLESTFSMKPKINPPPKNWRQG